MAAARLELEESRRVLGFPPAASSRWGLPLLRLFGHKRPEPEPIPVDKPLTAEQLQRHREEVIRAMEPGHFERLARDRRLVMECLSHYNSTHPNMEYEPAPGEVTRYIRSHDGVSWSHGLCGSPEAIWVLALPACSVAAYMRPLQVRYPLPVPNICLYWAKKLKDEQVTEGYSILGFPIWRGTRRNGRYEQVTEGYSILGFPIWRGTRRNGRWDCICKTCYRRYDCPDKSLACGHNETERICEMCYRKYGILHPFPGEFAYGYREYLYRCYYRP